MDHDPRRPCSINGLPGLILGMTIPRVYILDRHESVCKRVDETAIKLVQQKKP